MLFLAEEDSALMSMPSHVMCQREKATRQEDDGGID